jgi:hypothetical protein
MTVLARYLTHPQVKIDPDVPVPLWGLTAFGRARAETLANTGYFSDTTQISSSGERKHAPEFEAAYLADDLPFWFECLLDRCVASAECIADEYWSDPAFIQAYATALPELLGRALASAAPIKDGSRRAARSRRDPGTPG